ncbi:hypothetical protein EX30DRAFT_395355 [Ascodesmis nigricans]|uniref:Uncharacterized protein n=1 Tax=Ascodesmis nigricans TaxID=341454 RepID=A0A4S2MYX6_9PEZI|nr:hypothetical protein EX30DRAFT_395355 [Ascodesmis nigricans]
MDSTTTLSTYYSETETQTKHQQNNMEASGSEKTGASPSDDKEGAAGSGHIAQGNQATKISEARTSLNTISKTEKAEETPRKPTHQASDTLKPNTEAFTSNVSRRTSRSSNGGFTPPMTPQASALEKMDVSHSTSISPPAAPVLLRSHSESVITPHGAHHNRPNKEPSQQTNDYTHSPGYHHTAAWVNTVNPSTTIDVRSSSYLDVLPLPPASPPTTASRPSTILSSHWSSDTPIQHDHTPITVTMIPRDLNAITDLTQPINIHHIKSRRVREIIELSTLPVHTITAPGYAEEVAEFEKSYQPHERTMENWGKFQIDRRVGYRRGSKTWRKWVIVGGLVVVLAVLAGIVAWVVKGIGEGSGVEKGKGVIVSSEEYGNGDGDQFVGGGLEDGKVVKIGYGNEEWVVPTVSDELLNRMLEQERSASEALAVKATATVSEH